MPNDEAYNAVLKALSDMSDEWRIYRDTINRAINLLNHEVLEVADHQQRIATKIESIVTGQEQIRRWQAIRLGVEIASVLFIAAFALGVSR